MSGLSPAATAGKAAAAAVKRGVFIGGNWKCNPATRAAVAKLCAELTGLGAVPSGTTVVVAPPALYLTQVQAELKHPEVAVAAQNVWKGGAGAFTGELAVAQLKDLGVNWVILGHSERRSVVASESSGLVADKVRAALDGGLSVIAVSYTHLRAHET